jgi:hypothetical protein
MAVLLPIEMWVRVRANGYPDSYARFWAVDYWRVGTLNGVLFPSWEHLWFVAYLWTYTMLLGVALLVAGRRLMAWSEAMETWLLADRRLLWAPAAVLAAAKLGLLFILPEQQGLLTDWAGHAEYVPLLLFGFIAAGGDRIWQGIERVAVPAFAVAVLAGATVVAIEVAYPGDAVPSHGLMALDRAGRITMGWSMVLLLFHLARTRLDHDHRWRAPLARAVFPAYLIHHPVIVLVAWLTLPLHLSNTAAFALLVLATGAACWAVWQIGERIGGVGALIGLSPARSTVAPATA